MPSFHDFRFLSTDGKHNVFARECTPDGEVRAVLQIAHGVAEHIYRYAPFMEFLAENGFVVVANDHLGHGKTAENEQELCFFAEKDGWNDVVSDMDTLHKLTAAKYPDVPYFLFGHSMGSFLTRTYIIDHPEGLKGAEATAVAVYMGKSGAPMAEIRARVEEEYYSLDFTLDAIRDTYRFNETCQQTVPQALEAFFESVDFEDAIRNAISIGGDSDTLAAITGGVAGAYYGVPEALSRVARGYLDARLRGILERFEAWRR